MEAREGFERSRDGFADHSPWATWVPRQGSTGTEWHIFSSSERNTLLRFASVESFEMPAKSAKVHVFQGNRQVVMRKEGFEPHGVSATRSIREQARQDADARSSERVEGQFRFFFRLFRSAKRLAQVLMHLFSFFS
jgi:hypothetical protein